MLRDRIEPKTKEAEKENLFILNHDCKDRLSGKASNPDTHADVSALVALKIERQKSKRESNLTLVVQRIQGTLNLPR